jgi:hypothetical protein
MAASKNTMRSQRGGKLKKAILPEPERLPIPVRITPELIDRIDEIRPDMIPREPFVRHLLDIALTMLEEEG